jgi:transmembrane sensor
MEREEQHIEFKDQIVRYLAGEMTVSEREQFEKIIQADQDKKAQLSEYRKIWEGVDQLAGRNKYDMDGEWNLLSDKIDFGTEEKNDTRVRTLRSTVLRIAAMLVIGLIGVGGYYAGKQLLMYDKVAIETGTEMIELPDGTVVTLNSGSIVKYTKNESLAYRKVKLIGEAFFEVSRDTSRPFIIDAGPAQIEVLGTSFNVNAYPDNKKVEVTVHTGLVAMSEKNASDHQIMLSKGNTGIYSKEKEELNLIIAGNTNANAWKTRLLEFTDTPMKDVLDVLKHTYQADIILQDTDLSDYTITVSFNNQELDAVLTVLASTLDLTIKKEGEQIIIDTQ